MKPREVTEELGKRDKELQSAKELLDQSGVELNGLKEEVEYKNRQLASKDIEMESYKKATDEKIIQLEVNVKELEGKLSGSSPAA